MSETQYDDDMPQGDSIISDISLLGPEVDETVELDVDRKSRIALILTTSKSGLDLLSNIEMHCPMSGGAFGKTLVVNRSVHFVVGKCKLPKEFSTVGWRRASEDTVSRVTDVFGCVVVGSTEWKDMFKIVLK